MTDTDVHRELKVAGLVDSLIERISYEMDDGDAEMLSDLACALSHLLACLESL